MNSGLSLELTLGPIYRAEQGKFYLAGNSNNDTDFTIFYPNI